MIFTRNNDGKHLYQLIESPFAVLDKSININNPTK